MSTLESRAMRWARAVAGLVGAAIALAGCTTGSNVGPEPATSSASRADGLTPQQLKQHLPAQSALPSGWRITNQTAMSASSSPAAPPSTLTTDRKACDTALASLASNFGTLAAAESAQGSATLVSGDAVLDLHLIAFRAGQGHIQMSAIATEFAACEGATTQVNGTVVTLRTLALAPVGDDFGGITLAGAADGKTQSIRAAFTRRGDVGIALLEDRPGATDADFRALLQAAVTAAG